MNRIYKINQISVKLIIILAFSLSFFSCSTKRYLKKNEYLLIKSEAKIFDTINKQDVGYNIDAVNLLIRPKPNSRFFWIRVNLKFHNWYSEDKYNRKKAKKDAKCSLRKRAKLKKIGQKVNNERVRRNLYKKGSMDYIKYNKKLQRKQNKYEQIKQIECNYVHFSHKIGEAPVKYNLNAEFRNKRQIRIYFKNKGYYFCKIDSVAHKKNKRKKRIKLIYYVNTGKATRINDISYNILDSLLSIDIFKDTINTFLKKGKRLDIELLQKERQRITNKLRNNGYYKFTKDYIHYSIDTLGGIYNAKIIVNIGKTRNDKGEFENHKKYYINNVNIYPSFDPKKALAEKNNYYKDFDKKLSLINNRYIYFLNKKGTKQSISENAITKGTYIFQDSLYRLNDIKATYKYLSSMKIIKIANINFKEASTQDDSEVSFINREALKENIGFLDCDIKITQNKLQSLTFELEGTNTSGNIGTAGNMLYVHNNIFRNAEVLDLKLKAAIERQSNFVSEDASGNTLTKEDFFNSSELGIDISIKLPKLVTIIPLNSFMKQYNPKTVYSLNFNGLKRPDYTRTIGGFSFGYFWNTSKKVKHVFKPVTLDLIRLKNPTDEFLRYIYRLHLNGSYEDHLILATNYSLVINNQSDNSKKNTSYLKINSKIAGNTLSAIMNLSGVEKDNGSFHILDNAFAQFAKLDFDYRYYIKRHRANDKIVFRFFVGAAYPYGNSKVIPFGEKYFSGGANSIRAWSVRTLGPGSYSVEDYEDIFPNQTADIKMEGNFEYRMKLFWLLEGAFFIDAGNIWAINTEDERDGALFKPKTFADEIAIGTGYGFRFDFDFFIIRFDFGMKVKNPALPKGSRFILMNKKTKEDFTFNIGIGYPF